MGKTILLMRHAEASDSAGGRRDFERCLVEEGRLMARETARLLRSPDFKVDRILASSSLRTKQTAEIVAGQLRGESDRNDAPVVLMDSLYNAVAETIAASISQEAEEDDNTVLIVGHNPGIAALMCHWAAESFSVPPSTLAVFRFDATRWEDVRFYSPHSPRYLCLIQDGRVTWRASSFDSFRSE